MTCFALLFGRWDLNFEDVVIVAIDMSRATTPRLYGPLSLLVAKNNVARTDKFFRSVTYD